MENIKNKKQPLVSVILPVYNCTTYLKKAVESILAQTYQNFELIIIDDASTDETPQVISEYKKANPDKIRIVTLLKNLNGGGDKCANEGIKVARGKYIARMDADDIAHKDRLAKQVEFLENNKNVFLVGSNAYVINQKGKTIGEKIQPTSPYEIYKSYFTFHPLIHPSCMFRKNHNGKPFLYRVEYSANNDYLTFFTLLCKGAIFVNLPDKLLYYRIHGKNDTFKDVKRKFLNTLKIRLRMISTFGYRPTTKAIFLNFVQAVVVFSLPQSVLFNLYMVTRGILRKDKIIPTLKISISDPIRSTRKVISLSR